MTIQAIQELEALKRLHASINISCEVLQKENLRLTKEVESFKAQTLNAQNSLEIQKNIVTTYLAQGAEKEQQLVTQIMELQTEKKILKQKVKELEDN